MKLQKHIKEIVITLSVISITAWAYATLSNVSTGDGLTATLWNNMVADVNNNTDKLNWVYNSSGSIGIGTSNPWWKLHVNWMMMSENSSAPADKKKWNLGTGSDGTFYLQGINDSWAWWWNAVYFTRGTWPQISQTQFLNSWNPFMVIDHYSTNVWIWKTTPEQKLHVYWAIRMENSVRKWDIVADNSPDSFQIRNITSWTYPLYILANGNVWISHSNPSQLFHVNGTALAAAWNTSSDIRKKENIKSIINPLEKIKKLRWVTFNWKDSKKEDTWVIAQDVEKVFPEFVATWTDGYKSVDYGKLVAPLIESVKELKKENDELKKRIEALENK